MLVVLFFLLPLGQLQKLPLGISGVSLYIHDLVLVGLWALMLWRYVISIRGKKSLFLYKKGFFDRAQNDRVFVPFIVFTAIAFLSWLINYFRFGTESLIGLGYWFRWILLAAPLFFPFLTNRKSQITDHLRKSLIIFALFGLIQYLIFPDLTQLKYFGWDDHYFRLIGTLLDPNFMGILIVIGLGLEFKRVKCSFLRKLFYLITLGFTYSRASWLAWLVLLFSYTVREIFTKPIKEDIFLVFRTLVRSFKVPVFYFWLIASAIIFILLPRPKGEGGNLARTASISGRLHSYQQAWEIVKESPILGVGFNNYRLALKQMDFEIENIEINNAAAGADNSFLFVWATSGIFGLIAFGWLVFSLRPIWLILPIVVHSFFNNTLFFPWVLIYIWAIQAEDED